MTLPNPPPNTTGSVETDTSAPANWIGDWYPHWRNRPARTGRTRDWKDCSHCVNKNVYRGLGVYVCAFQAQPADCGRYSYKFHPWLRADCDMWCDRPEPETYDATGLPSPITRDGGERDSGSGEGEP
jgi:hypothetical protein